MRANASALAGVIVALDATFRLHTQKSLDWHWQLSRVYALLGQAENAKRSAKICLHYSEDTSPFFIGYGHEALARSAAVADDVVGKAHHLAEARRYLAQVTSDRDRALLQADLQSLEGEAAA